MPEREPKPFATCKHCGAVFWRAMHAFGHWGVEPCRRVAAAREIERCREAGEPPPFWP